MMVVMSAELVSWHQIARSAGYTSEKEMLEDLYLKKQLSIREIAAQLGFFYRSVHSRLKRYGIPLRSRGGINHTTKG